jgi:hypothetical protein
MRCRKGSSCSPGQSNQQHKHTVHLYRPHARSSPPGSHRADTLELWPPGG